jgi:hypothetical protein
MAGLQAIAISTLVLGLLAAPRAAAAPATAHHLAIQGVARDPTFALVPSGDVVVRIYADSIGGTAVYDSGVEFADAITQGIFDLVAGRGAPLLLDSGQSYFLELDVGGEEVVGDAAGGRWRFYPGGGSRVRPDLEARLHDLEVAMGLSPATSRAAASARSAAASASLSGSFSSTHALLGLGTVTGGGGYSATANLLAMPVGVRETANLRVELGPYYLFAPTPHPAIRFVRDVPGDQGRAVRVRWRNDLRERPYSPSDTMPRITSYTLYRRVGQGQAAALRAAPVLAATPDLAGTLVLPPGEWDVLTSVPATLDTSYQTVVPTLCDSTSAGICWSTFVVRAITDQTGRFNDSFADSGYSVDNIAPGVPSGLIAQAVAGGTALSWQPSAAPDFQYFRVYRGTDPGFTPDPGSLVHATATTEWTDPVSGAFTYKLTAVDSNGNESAPASTSITTSVDGAVPVALGFASVAPNPFRRSLTFVVDVPVACAAVDLTVFDLAGRRVRTIASGALPPGRHTLRWDGRSDEGGRLAAGVYVARLAGAGRTLTRRVTLVP